MKRKKCIGGMILVVLTSFVCCSYADTIGHWRLDESSGTTAFDSVFIQHGTLEGTPVWQPAEGIEGAIQLNDNLDRVLLPSIDIGSRFTAMAWVKPDNGNQSWARLLTSQYKNGFYLGTYSNSGEWMFIVNNTWSLHAGTAASGVWQHVAGVFNGTYAELFVNGVSVGGPIAMSPPSVPDQVITIGLEAGNTTDASIQGLVDDVAIFNEALSAAEILDIYNHGVAGKSINDWQADNPQPQNYEADVDTSATLQWTSVVDPNIVSHVLYLGTNPLDVFVSVADDPNGDTTVTVLPAETTNHTPDGLLTDTTYYWRVDERDAAAEVISRGAIWAFTTVLTLPEIVTQPADQLVEAGDTAVFTVVADNVLSYHWCKGTPGSGTELLSTDPNYTGVESPTLSVVTAEPDDVGTYYCKITNGAGTIESEAAKLRIIELAGYWNLNGNLLDSVGDNNGVMTEPNFANGVGGTQGLIFFGDRAMEIADTNAFNFAVTEPFSLACWIKGPPGDGTMRPDGVRHMDDALISKMMPTSPYSGYELHVNRANNGGLVTFWVISAYGTENIEVDSALSVLDDTWHHVVATYDGSASAEGVKIYIDGISDALTVNRDNLTTSGTSTNDVSLTMGARSGATMHLLEGQLDDVRVYNYSLSPMEVAQLYSGIAGSYCLDRPALDLNGDCIVSLPDLAELAAQWLECGIYPDCY